MKLNQRICSLGVDTSVKRLFLKSEGIRNTALGSDHSGWGGSRELEQGSTQMTLTISATSSILMHVVEGQTFASLQSFVTS